MQGVNVHVLFQNGFTNHHAYLPIQPSDRSRRRDLLVSITSNEPRVSRGSTTIERDHNDVSEPADAVPIPLFDGKR